MTCPGKQSPIATATQADSQPRGRAYWRSLEELAGSAEFEAQAAREFPALASEMADPVSRRQFLSVMAASLALAGVGGGIGGCADPEEKIIPYVVPPEQLVPGKPLFYATAMPCRGYAVGALAEQHMGRPTKLEGNPDHPATLGRSDAQLQASILSLYDPDRAQTITHLGQITTWSVFLTEIRSAIESWKSTGGQGVRLLTETVTSPTLTRQIHAFLELFPAARWHRHDCVGDENVHEGSRLAFGRLVETFYRFDLADRILALDADFLSHGPAAVRYNHDFAERRRVRLSHSAEPVHGSMNRLYVVESTSTITGANADHRLAMRAGDVEAFARTMLSALRGEPQQNAWIDACAADLLQRRGKAVVVPGQHQPPAVHALAHAMNELLGAAGQTVLHTEPIDAAIDPRVQGIGPLVADMNAGAVRALIVLGINPVQTAPIDLDFAAAMARVPLRLHHSLYADETSFHCHWHVPESHYLEAWSDLRAFDGTATIAQPLIQPLYEGKSSHELLAVLLGGEAPGREIVRETWREHLGAGGDFEAAWRAAVERGVIEGTASAPVQVSIAPGALPAAAAARSEAGGSDLEVVFRPDPSIDDGRYANNGWLQELPKPLTKLTWGNAALLSPQTAQMLRVSNEEVISIDVRGHQVEAPVWIVPGHAEASITLHLGHGRSRAGRVGNGVGTDANAIRFSDQTGFARGVTVRTTGRREPLACTQPHQMIPQGRQELMRVTTFDALTETRHAENNGRDGKVVHLSLYPERPEPQEWLGMHQWGMVIDQNTCTGCNACVVACQAENNIPVVGRTEVLRGREMHWLRIDTYYHGDPSAPDGPHFQPMLCQHCEKAPCEYVCPVIATSHSAEGLNEMTYNRCIGTRYCSNNCPYKVRRFNFLRYADVDVPVEQLRHNPDVTVRQRGVMEKCTYCVQRINDTRREIKKLHPTGMAAGHLDSSVRAAADRLLDGLETACQQACPTSAIVFGDLNHHRADGSRSAVAQLKDEPTNYGLLTELNTVPRTTYLERIRNPNPAMPA